MKYKKGQKLIVNDEAILIHDEVVTFVRYEKHPGQGTYIVVSHPTQKTIHKNGNWYLDEAFTSTRPYNRLYEVLK